MIWHPLPSGRFAALLCAFPLLCCWGQDASEVSFSREVLPILSDRCFHCHGPDAEDRKADLRLDLEPAAKAELEDGFGIIVPGDLEKSEFWYRIVTEDEDDLMPPPDSHRKPISPKEREILRRWILAGAPWGGHWAFEKPERPTVPDLAPHPVDAFVLRRLQEDKLAPSPPADSPTLLRRLAFDLTGLPPAAFADLNLDPTDWATTVDQLLASPHHGERLAMWWLDAARYSDTDGFQQDNDRNNWPWRDWVVKAFNSNLPFDRFTREQFAGDLLPEATPEQILATCFHRNHMTNGEGGRDPEESRVDYVIDRVNTTGTVWLGLTLGCVQCHSHKFDPIEQADYYRLSAFFDSIDEDGKAGGGAKPYHEFASPHTAAAIAETEAFHKTTVQRRDAVKAEAQERFASWLEAEVTALPKTFQTWTTLTGLTLATEAKTLLTEEPGGIVQASGPIPFQDDYTVAAQPPDSLTRVAGIRLEILPHASHTNGALSRGKDGHFILTNVRLTLRKKGSNQMREVAIAGAVADFQRKVPKGQLYGLIKDTLDDDPRRGWTSRDAPDPKAPRVAVFRLAEPVDFGPGDELSFLLRHRSTTGNANIGRFRLSVTDQAGRPVRAIEPSPYQALVDLAPATVEEIPSDLHALLLGQFLEDDRSYQEAVARASRSGSQLGSLKKMTKSKVMVLKERKDPRTTHVLERGVWDAKGEAVKRGVLPSILDWPADRTKTRLDLADWLVSTENPLTARVLVNHLWQLVFGSGLVRTPGDLGLQGEQPTHPDLLDWLAVEFMESGWDIRHLLRLIVTSETYRQSSHATPELLELDPENRLLARAPRFRLPAWMIRDTALAASGLLNPTVGGPPVHPYQPAGVWGEITMGRFTYRPSVGPAQYRRTLYAFWRRTIAPTFLFDSAQRRVCEVGVRRTNTPLQALTLWNDTTMLEASRALADGAVAADDPIQHLGDRLLSRALEKAERSVITREQQRALTYYREHPEEAQSFATVGQQPAPALESAPEVASWMAAASMLLTLDETITHE